MSKALLLIGITFFIFNAFSLFIFVNAGLVKATNNQIGNEGNSKDTFTNVITSIGSIIAATIGAIATVLVASKEYKKRKDAQVIEHQNRLEYNYSIDLRKRRLKAYTGLWELTHIKFNEKSSKTEIINQKDQLSKWYYESGKGMLLTEPSQKLFSNFKRHLKDLSDKWDNLSPEEKIYEIKYIKGIASGLRTSLLKDVGTRAELKSLSSYDELRIEKPTIKENIYHERYFEFRYAFFGSKSIEIKNKEMSMQIINLDNNKPIDIVKGEQLETLEPGAWHHFKWPLDNKEYGYYAARIIVEEMIMSEIPFEYLPKIDDN